MPAFVNSVPLFRRRIKHASAGVNVQSPSSSSFQSPLKRRREPRACAAPLHDDDNRAATKDILYDDMVSDEDYVVLDGKDIAMLVEELQQTGRDQIGTSSEDDVEEEEGLSEDFLTLAEKRSDEWNGRASAEDGAEEEQNGSETSATDQGPPKRQVGMDYFTDDHVKYMPSWAAEAYQSGEHRDLEEAALRIDAVTGGQRLHDIVARKKVIGVKGLKDASVGGDGIVDCNVQDVAEDYSIPVEFVVDAMTHYGVPVPIRADQSIRDSMTTEEIERLLKLITSFDAVDLSDRYSDRTISELAEDYDVSVEQILDFCQKEGLFVFSDEKTRLSVVREDRVLDVILKGGARGQPYPSLLQGLEN